MLKENTSPARRLLSLGVLGLVLSVFWALLGPVEQAAALPPRPTDTPTPSPVTAPKVGYIVLQPSIQLKAKIGWTVVQWQDGFGRWQTGGGWQGTLDEDGQKTWAVLAADLGKGPFRWVAYDKPNGKVLATSASFSLPKHEGASVNVPLK